MAAIYLIIVKFVDFFCDKRVSPLQKFIAFKFILAKRHLLSTIQIFSLDHIWCKKKFVSPGLIYSLSNY